MLLHRERAVYLALIPKRSMKGDFAFLSCIPDGLLSWELVWNIF